MSELAKLLWIVWLLFVLMAGTVAALVTYNLHTNAENRKLYAECLRITERLAEVKPNSITGLYCSR